MCNVIVSYMKFQTGVKVLAHDTEGRFLVIKRAQPLLDGTSGTWDIPGGRREPEDKTLVGTAERETWHETGARLWQPEPFHIQIFTPAEDLTVVRFTFIAVATGNVVLSDEHCDYKVLWPERALQLPLDPFTREVFEMALQQGY